MKDIIKGDVVKGITHVRGGVRDGFEGFISTETAVKTTEG